ncbi:Ig-like domain-containing protein [Paenibacillus sp. GCM10012306]|uniref:Ig-like domain-containing protein n=1 Tax=Paenibacillus sp. GCM10012306 TaxID=3317342 RepID=UPI003614C38A
MSDMSYPTKENSQFMNVQGGEKKVMKKILSVALSTAMAFSMFASVAFGDAAATTPQQKFDALAAKGILNGFPDGKAHLENDLTRAEFAKIVTKLFDLPEVTNKLSYKDKGYTATNWAVPYIEAVTAANLMEGKDTVKGIFDYNGKVTVEEVATVLFRALKLEAPATTDNNASAWAKGYVQAIIDKGLIAKNIAFKANATRSLVVEAAYAVDQLSSTPVLTVASAEAISPTKVVVTFSDKTTTTVELTTALVAGAETSITFKHQDKEYTTKVTLQAPKVIDVEAPNAKQLVVKFNRAVDTDTIAEDGKVIKDVVQVTALSGAPAVTTTGAEVSFNADNTEAKITVPNLEYLKGQYTVVVSDAVKTTSGEKVAAFTKLLTVADTTAPTVATINAVAKTTTNKVYVKFSEPVKPAGIIAYVNGQAATVQRDTYDTFVLTTANLTSGTTYDVSLNNVTDFAGNVANPNPIKTSVTVVSDVAAPVIKSVTPIGDRYVEVKFDKKVNKDSLVGNVRLLDANGDSRGVFTVVTTSDSDTIKLRSPLGSLPQSGTFTGSIVFGQSVRDTLGNTLSAAATQAITFTKDTTAPGVVSATYSAKGLVIKFSKEVVLDTAATNNKAITIVNEATGQVSATLYVKDGSLSSDKKTLTYAAALGGADYTVRLPQGLVTDDSFANNAFVATTVALKVGSTVTNDTERPEVKSIVAHNNFAVEGGVVVTGDVYYDITVTDNEALNVQSLRDVNSYTLDDKALPVGTLVTIEKVGKDNDPKAPKEAVVRVTIPASTFAKTQEYKFTAFGIADKAGNGILVAENKTVLTDRVKPTLASAAVSSGDKTVLVVAFSEDVKEIRNEDLIFKINDVEVAPHVLVAGTPTVATTVRAGAGSDAGKFYFSFKNIDGTNGLQDLNANNINTVTVEVRKSTTTPVKFDNAIKDIAGNAVVTGTVVSAK